MFAVVCGVKIRGLSDLQTYSHWVIEEVSRRSGAFNNSSARYFDFKGWSRESGYICFDVSSIDFYTPRTAQKKSDSVTEPDEDETNNLPDF